MSGRTSGDKKDPAAVEATVDDLPSVDTNPLLRPVDTSPLLKPVATITLDEEPPPAPGATQLLNPIDDVPTDPKMKARPAAPVLDVKADGPSTQRRRAAPLKSDAFESMPGLHPTRKDEGPRGPPAPWQKTAVWTPGLIALTVVGILMLLVVLLVVLRG